MGNFIEMLMEFKNVTAENEDHAGLSKFFGLLSRFNRGRPLHSDFALRIEQYFEYYWAKDLNYAVKSEDGERFLSELPKEIRINVRMSFILSHLDLQRLLVSQFSLLFQKLFSALQG